MGPKTLCCNEMAFDKNIFHNKKSSISMSWKLIEWYYLIKLHMIIKVHLNATFDIGTKMEPFHH